MAGRVISRDNLYPSNQDPLSVQVCRWLQQNGYVLADMFGREHQIPYESDRVNILTKEYEFRGWGFWIFRTRRRRRWIGSIWFHNKARESTPKRWHFDVHTHGSSVAADKLARQLAFAFKVDIVTEVTNDYVFDQIEHFWWERQLF